MSCGNNISSTHWDRLVELVTAKVCWKLGGAQLAGLARCKRCIGSWKPVGGSGIGDSEGLLEARRCPVGGSGKGAKGALEAGSQLAGLALVTAMVCWKPGGAQLAGLARCKRCIGSRKPVGGSVGTSQTAKSPNFWEIGQTGPFFVSKNAWHGLPP
jgi:hypothetical protein